MLTALRESAKKSLIAKQFADQAQAKIEEVLLLILFFFFYHSSAESCFSLSRDSVIIALIVKHFVKVLNMKSLWREVICCIQHGRNGCTSSRVLYASILHSGKSSRRNIRMRTQCEELGLWRKHFYNAILHTFFFLTTCLFYRFSSPEVFRYGSEMPITAKEVDVSKLPWRKQRQLQLDFFFLFHTQL